MGYTVTVLEVTGDCVRGRVVFEAGFVGFDGHFPAERGGAILPGFYAVAVAVEMLETALGQRFELRGVEAGKFLRAILPGEVVAVEMVLAGDAWDVVMTVREERCGNFRMLVGKN